MAISGLTAFSAAATPWASVAGATLDERSAM